MKVYTFGHSDGQLFIDLNKYSKVTAAIECNDPA